MLKNENVFDGKILESLTKVYRRKASGFVAHAGLRLNFECGTQVVLHTNPNHNAHLSCISEFTNGERLVVKESYLVNKEIISRIEERIFKDLKYSIFNNCEHLVNEVLTGIPSSAQLKSALVTSVIGTGSIALVSGKRNVEFLSIMAVGFGLIGLHIEKQNQLKL